MYLSQSTISEAGYGGGVESKELTDLESRRPDAGQY